MPYKVSLKARGWCTTITDTYIRSFVFWFMFLVLPVFLAVLPVFSFLFLLRLPIITFLFFFLLWTFLGGLKIAEESRLHCRLQAVCITAFNLFDSLKTTKKTQIMSLTFSSGDDGRFGFFSTILTTSSSDESSSSSRLASTRLLLSEI